MLCSARTRTRKRFVSIVLRLAVITSQKKKLTSALVLTRRRQMNHWWKVTLKIPTSFGQSNVRLAQLSPTLTLRV
ncbi:hypothetical protein B0H10DRAFT_1975511 [Mycena sp. CBHHK59/15]|nr:hypothetical protein B0H10DRAFT_1975511 [Mycena sp. CBHHK59/15]